MEPNSLVKLNEARRERQAAILLSEIGKGRDRVIREGDTVAGPLGEAVAKAFRSGKSGMFELDGQEFFLNVHVPAPRIVVIGAVHISQALAPMAKIAGYDIEIIDPRTAFATPERFEGVALRADWPEEAMGDGYLDAYSALVAVTHDPKIDDYPLIQALKSNCFYVGALGSRKTHAKRVERLKEAGISDERIARISAPIGLDIGAASPQEIAVAVLADIIQAFRKRELSAAEQAKGAA